MAKVNCPECDKSFRAESGLRWHLSNPNGPHAVMSEIPIEEAVKKACQGGSPQVALRDRDTLTEAMEPIAALESRVAEFERMMAELQAIQKHWLDEADSRITSLDNSITKSVQETQRAIKSLETKQATNEAEVRQLTRRLESIAEKVDSYRKSTGELDKELFDAIDSHFHEVVTTPDGRKERRVKRRPTIGEIAIQLLNKG